MELNLYFMVDSQNNNMNDQGEIDRILSTTECKNVLLVGDINCDFSRPTQFVQRTLAEEKGLNIFWNLSDNDRIEDVSYTYSKQYNSHFNN